MSGIDLHGPNRRQEFKSIKGFLTQAVRIDEAIASTETFPRCRWCERLGDTIIVLHAPQKAALISADRVFEAFGSILDREIRRLPSLAELKRKADEEAAQDAPS